MHPLIEYLMCFYGNGHKIYNLQNIEMLLVFYKTIFQKYKAYIPFMASNCFAVILLIELFLNSYTKIASNQNDH